MPGDSSVHSAATIQKVPFANCGKIRRLIPIGGVSTRPSEKYGIVKPSQGGIYARVVKIEQTPRSARRSTCTTGSIIQSETKLLLTLTLNFARMHASSLEILGSRHNNDIVTSNNEDIPTYRVTILLL